MKKLLLATAAVFMAVLGTPQADAGLVLTSTNGTFNFNPGTDADAIGSTITTPTGLTIAGDNGLNDMAIYLGYRTGGGLTPEQTVFRQLTNGDSNAAVSTFGPGGNFGQFDFDQIDFGNGVTVDGQIDFRLSDTSTSPTDQRGTLLYNLRLDTAGVDEDNQGQLLSFVGFDFDGGIENARGNETIIGFGAAPVGVGEDGRALAGDYQFAANSANSNTVTGARTNLDIFDGPVNGQINNAAFLDARFDGNASGDGDTFTSPGDISFGPYNEFQLDIGSNTDISAGAIGFRTTIAQVPEPSTLLMASMGLGMVAFRRRRKQA